jgi:hypothetical protein
MPLYLERMLETKDNEQVESRARRFSMSNRRAFSPACEAESVLEVSSGQRTAADGTVTASTPVAIMQPRVLAPHLQIGD